MPAVYKLIEIQDEKGIKTDVIFISRDEKDNIKTVIQNITESLSTLMKKELDLFSSKINQK